MQTIDEPRGTQTATFRQSRNEVLVLCLEVSINGEFKCRAGSVEAQSVTVQVDALPEQGSACVDIAGGVHGRNGGVDFASWGLFSCHIGDEVLIRVVESSDADAADIVRSGPGEGDTKTSGPVCLFCGKSYTEAQSMVRLPRGHICDECIGHVNEVLVGSVT
jgi:hypothetical protein